MGSSPLGKPMGGMRGPSATTNSQRFSVHFRSWFERWSRPTARPWRLRQRAASRRRPRWRRLCESGGSPGGSCGRGRVPAASKTICRTNGVMNEPTSVRHFERIAARNAAAAGCARSLIHHFELGRDRQPREGSLEPDRVVGGSGSHVPHSTLLHRLGLCQIVVTTWVAFWLGLKAVMSEIQLNWSIGRFMSQKITEEAWGKGTVEMLAETIRRPFPGHRWVLGQ